MNWKLWAGTAAILVVLALAGWRIRSAFSEKTPSWMRPEHHASEAIPATVHKAYGRLLEQAKRTAQQTERPVGSIDFLELPRDEKKAVRWTSDFISNQGFAPMSHFEVPFYIGATNLLGYYTLDGEPIPYTLRHLPNSKQLGATVHLREPLGAGASQLILRREIRPVAVEQAVPVGRLRKLEKEVQAAGIWLSGYKVVRSAPANSVLDFSAGDDPVLGWISDLLETEAASPWVTVRRQ